MIRKFVNEFRRMDGRTLKNEEENPENCYLMCVIKIWFKPLDPSKIKGEDLE